MKTTTMLLLLLVSNIVFGGDGDGGQAGAFLRRGVGSKALALGKAYTAIANDASSVYWNPAGLSYISGTNIVGMYSVLTFDRKESFISVGHTIPGLFSIGAGWLRFGVSDIDGRDASGKQTKKFDDAQNCMMLSLSRKFDILSIGITGKYLSHSLEDYKASGLGFDVGAALKITDELSCGIVLQDAASSQKWNTPSSLNENFPMIIRVGCGYSSRAIPLVVSAEMCKMEGGKTTTGFGAEYRFMENFGLRAGYNENPSFGGFICLGSPENLIAIDYAATKDLLEDSFVHHISVLFNF